MKIAILVIYFILTVSGMVFMKLGADNPVSISIKPIFNMTVGYISLLGYVLYICSFLLWTKIITMFNLTYIVPIATGIVQVLTFILALVIFKEKVSIYSIIGIIAIVAGILLLNFKK